jgi:hypothetical protein
MSASRKERPAAVPADGSSGGSGGSGGGSAAPGGSTDPGSGGSGRSGGGSGAPGGSGSRPTAKPARKAPVRTPATPARPARPAKSGRPAKPATPAKAATPAEAARPAKPARAGGRPGTRGVPGPGLVVGPVPVLARVAGGLAVVAVLVRLAVPAAPLAHAGRLDLGGGNAFDWIALLPFAVVVGGAGVLALLGRLPRLALAVLLPTGTAAVGLLLATAYLLDARDRGSQDLPLGLATSFRYTAGGGLWLLFAAHATLVAAFLAAGLAWSRTGMEDEGSFDGLRPKAALAGLTAGVLGALGVGMAQLDPSVPGAAAPPLLQQSGLAELGGLVLAVAVAGWGTFAATLRPRLATVGAFAGLAALLGTEALRSALVAARSPVVGAGTGLVTEAIAAVLFAVLALGAWRLPGRPVPDEEEIT